jgi:hypothetical protein
MQFINLIVRSLSIYTYGIFNDTTTAAAAAAAEDDDDIRHCLLMMMHLAKCHRP